MAFATSEVVRAFCWENFVKERNNGNNVTETKAGLCYALKGASCTGDARARVTFTLTRLTGF